MYIPFLILLAIGVNVLRSEDTPTACKENEMYMDCESNYCGPRTCEELGYPKPCPGGTAACHGGCVCFDGYVLNENNTCIPMKDCPSCGGDKNATTGCSNHCGNTCNDYKEVNKTCFSGCRYNGCECRKGYVYLEAQSRCVLPVDCTKEVPEDDESE